MKRLEAIAPLSRDHHNTLILAQLLKKDAPVYPGLPVLAKDRAAFAQKEFEAHIKKHFQQEETMLEKVKDCHPDIDILAAAIKTEHRELTDLFNLLDAVIDPVDTMHTLAVLLEKHVRKEERELFPLLQQHCSETLLQEIHELLH